MTDYSELVKALRGLANGTWKNCEYTWFGGEEKVFADAAAAIEALQAEVKRLNMRCADCEYGNSEWPEDPEHTKMPKRGEWIDRYDEDDKPFFKRKYVCSACGGWNTYGKSKYCPNCGAKMEVQNENR